MAESCAQEWLPLLASKGFASDWGSQYEAKQETRQRSVSLRTLKPMPVPLFGDQSADDSDDGEVIDDCNPDVNEQFIDGKGVSTDGFEFNDD